MINIFKSEKIWDHIPTPEELRAEIDPGKDAIVKKLPPNGEILQIYLDLCGVVISYNGSKKNPRYSSGVLYYINKDNAVVTTDLKIDNIILE